MTIGPLMRKKPWLFVGVRRKNASQTIWQPSINIPESLKMDIILRTGWTLCFWTVKLSFAMRWFSCILIASRTARIAFTPNAAEKAAVLIEKDQLRGGARGNLDEGGSINAAIMAKETPMKDHPVKWKNDLPKKNWTLLPNDSHAKTVGMLTTSVCLPHNSQHR